MAAVAVRLACIFAWLALDAMVACWLASAVMSFALMDWAAASASELGRAAWLAAFLYLARHSVGEAIAFADRRIRPRAQPSA